MSDGLHEADSKEDIADMFRTQFSNVFTNEHVDPDIVIDAIEDVPRLSTSVQQIIITDDMVASASKELKSSTGCVVQKLLQPR